MVEIPASAKQNGVRIRWWQPEHPGPFNGDWAIDNVVIGGNESNPFMMQDGFLSDSPNSGAFQWLQFDNTQQGEFCGSTSAIKGTATSKENVTLTTVDIDVQANYMLQFEISVGCDATGSNDMLPIHLEYSADYGLSWDHVVEECLPFFPHCQGKATTASVYYASPAWHRITLTLQGHAVSK